MSEETDESAERGGDIGGPEAIGPLAVLPVFFRLADKRVALAGDSDAVAWKAELIAATGARIDLFAPNPSARLATVARRHGKIALFRRLWTAQDLAGASLAIGDGADLEAAAAFAAAARAVGAPVNIIDRPELCDFSFGAIVNRSPLVIGISTDGAAPVFAQSLRARLEALLAPHLALWAKAARDWRKRLSQSDLDFRRRRDFWERFSVRAWRSAGAPTQGDFEAIAAEGAAASATGRIALVGAGPGDPDLLTLKAVRALQSADVILHDDLIGAGALELARREAIRIPVGKRGYGLSRPQDETTALAVRLAQEGKTVVRLKGGDPSIFGRANEEIAAARLAGVEISVVPGVTAALAAAAALATSLSDGERVNRVQFITAHGPDGDLPADLDWRALADAKATTAVYMGRKTLPGLVARLIAEGIDPATPAAIVANASLPQSMRWVGPFGQLSERGLAGIDDGPCVVIFGRALEGVASDEASASR